MSIVKTNIEGALAQITAKVARGVMAGALLIEADAKLFAPVRTGNHRRSIHTDFVQTSTRIAARVTHYSDYGIFLEFGTRHMAARPHFTPAFEKNRDVVGRMIAEGA